MPSGNFCVQILSDEDSGVPTIDYIVITPTIAFIIFLLFHLKPSLRKLKSSESLEMGSYYGFLWFVCLLNIFRFIVQLLLSTISTLHNPVTLAFWLIVRFLLLFVETSVIVFMSHKHSISGRTAFRSTIKISSAFAFLVTFLMALLVYVDNLSLYDLSPGNSALFWMIFNAVVACIYFVLIIIPHTRYSIHLPERPEFLRYVFLLLCLNIIASFGALLVFLGISIGFCFWDLSIILYFSLYPPLLYFSFLHDFFRESQSAFRNGLMLNRYLQMEDTTL